jgi:hypothetical protein
MGIYLTARQAVLVKAISVASPAQKVALETESDQLSQAATYEVSDDGFCLSLLAWLRSLSGPTPATQLVNAVQADPVLSALGQPSALNAASAAAVIALSNSHKLGLSDMPALKAASGSEDAFAQLLWAAMRNRLSSAPENRTYLYRDVAVLLPLRFETRFDPVPTGWKMRLRIVPDEPSIRRDNPTPTTIEANFLTEMWQAIFNSLSPAEQGQEADTWLETPQGIVEFEALCRKLGGGRAAWLAGSFTPVVADGGLTLKLPDPVAPPEDRIAGFPKKLEVWIGFLNDPPIQVDVFDVATDKLIFDVIGARRLADDSLVEEKDRWWVSWQTAVDVGMGREIILPYSHSRDDIRSLFVIGIGEENPEELFKAHIDAGFMSLLSLGSPTNTVDGKAAADLGKSADSWRGVVERRLRNIAGDLTDDLSLSQSLAGHDASLPALPLASGERIIDRVLVQALWTALWGHQMRDLWGCVDESDRLAKWSFAYLRPEGCLPPLRIAEQPYGLLPTSALSQWQVSTEEGELAKFETRLQPVLLAMRRFWAEVAAQSGTSVGADTKRLLELISRDAASANYVCRLFLPVELWEIVIGSAVPLDPAKFENYVHELFKPVYKMTGRGPDSVPGYRFGLAGGGYAGLEIPLVKPTTWPYWYFTKPDGTVHLDHDGNRIPVMSPEQGFVKIIESILELGHRIEALDESFRKTLPDSLLVRLLIDSCLLSAAAVVQANAGPTQPILEALVGDSLTPTNLDSLANLYLPSVPHNHPAGEVRRAFMEGADLLRKAVKAQPANSTIFDQLERAFRAVLDTSTHRIDPWINGFASRRLEYLRGRPETRFRLGVYGWVNGPILGKPGPTAGGLLHAPSHGQALTAVILRDKYISEGLEDPAPAGGRNLWSMQLESQRIRLADEIADEVRIGSHIYEAVGRRVEQIFASATAVDALRLAYPLRPGQMDRSVPCHGINALQDTLLGATPAVVASGEQRNQLLLLQSSIDSYGDLLVSEAVYQVVNRRSDVAGAAMDAAAGLAAPPSLEFTKTPVTGDSLNTAVISLVPFVAAETSPDPSGSPARIADASVAALMEAKFGSANFWNWTYGAASVSLAEIGLAPIDTAVLSEEWLQAMMRHRLKATADAALSGNGSMLHRQARALVRALGSQPLLLGSIAPLDESGAVAATTKIADQAILAELKGRYTVLNASAQALKDDLTKAHHDNDTAKMASVLFRSMRWGITPAVTATEQAALFSAMFDNAPPEDKNLLPRLTVAAKQALQQRLDAAPAGDSKQPIARSIAELAAPEGQVAILSKVSGNDVATKSRVHTAAEDDSLGEEWLAVVAAVRPYMARLEALQLEMPELLTSWSSAPDDHWQTAALKALQIRRGQPGGGDRRLALPRFIAAYMAGNIWGNNSVAAGLIDSWGEVIPQTRCTTTAAFGFNAPAARPPQAILLAVPPDIDAEFGAEMTVSKLVQIVLETRELAHARALDAERLDAYLAAIPMAKFQGAGATGVRVDKGTSFPS